MIKELFKVVIEVPETVYREHFFSKSYGKVVQGAKVNAIDFGFEMVDNDITEQHFEWAVFDNEAEAVECEQTITDFFNSLLLESTTPIEEYDVRGNLIHYKDDSEEWWKVYDSRGNMTAYSDHTGRGKIMDFDGNGNRVYLREFDGKGSWSEYSYEYGYYLKTEMFSNSNGEVYKVQYDPSGEPI